MENFAVALRALAVFAGVMAVAWRHRRHAHPFERFGPANVVTSVRAAGVACVTSLLFMPAARVAWPVVVLAVVTTVLDGLDGWLARRTRMASAFGARFDMEVDALLIQALATAAWWWDKSGVWVLASGLMRYGFVIAGTVWPWLNEPLFPSLRRKAVCVVQIAALVAVVAPVVQRPVSARVAGAGLLALAWSFAVDSWWLWRQRLVR